MAIQKKINYCWFGQNPKSDLILKCIDSWKKMCPDYEIIEWNESNYDIHKNQYMEEAYDAQKWAFVSDYARLDIIYNHGGIYLDTDVELLKSLDEIISDSSAFFCFEDEYINTGLGFGAEKKSDIVKELLDSYGDLKFKIAEGKYDMLSCPKRNSTIFDKYADRTQRDKIIRYEDIVFYPKEYFCPLDYETKILNQTNNTIAIHWYGESWLTNSKKIKKKIKRFIVKIIGIDNFNKIKNLFNRRKNEE